VLTPVGRGSSMLIIGRSGAGMDAVLEDAILGQSGTGVCVCVCVCMYVRACVRV